MGTTIINGNTKPIKGNGNVQLYCLNEELLKHTLNSLNLNGSLSTIINIDPNCEDPQFFIKAEANIFPLLEINNHGGSLDIGFKNNASFSTTHAIECIIQAPSLQSLSLIGSGNVKGNYYGSDLTATVAGSGKIELYGNTEKLNASIQGSGKQKLKNLVSQHSILNVMGSGDLSCFTIQSVKANVMGSGTIKIAGTTLKIQKDVLGSGQIDIQKNYTPEISPFIFKKMLTSFKDFDTNTVSEDSNDISFDKNGSISVNQYSKSGNNVLVIEGSNVDQTTTVKESFFSKLKKYF